MDSRVIPSSVTADDKTFAVGNLVTRRLMSAVNSVESHGTGGSGRREKIRMRGVLSRLSRAVTAPLLNWQSRVPAGMALASPDIFICSVQV